MTVSVHLTGGLGNQMFQYAIGRQLAYSNGSRLQLDLSEFDSYRLHQFSLGAFDIQADLVHLKPPRRPGLRARLQRKTVWAGKTPRLLVEESLLFDRRVLQARGHLHLLGYWQNEKYFPDVRSTLRKELQVRSAPIGKNAETLDAIDNCFAVSVHVRRGDYVTDPSAQQRHGICGLNYYDSAMRTMLNAYSSAQFFVFSDDIEWCRKNFAGPNLRFVDHNDALTNYEDLRLMSRCKHHVIANSSFSWWGAWLNPSATKRVIAPLRWTLDENRESEDIVPDGWQRL